MEGIEKGFEKKEIDRRDFLKKAAVGSAGFIVSFHLPVGLKRSLADAPAAPSPAEIISKYPPNAFIQIRPDDSVQVTVNKLEMGQGIFTSMCQLIAEELDCDWNKVRAISAPVDPVYNATFMPIQLTGGSNALNTGYDQYRRIGAVMRLSLLQAGANRWKVAPAECKTDSGYVIHSTHGKLSYGSLAEEAAKLPLPKEVGLKADKDFKIIGRSMPRIDSHEKATGKATFGIDVKLPDMVYAVIFRSPVIGGKIKSVQDTATRAIPGVLDVVRFQDSVAVLGKNTWAAWKGRDALEIQWDFQGKDKGDSESLAKSFRDLAAPVGSPVKGASVEKRGAPDAALAKSTHRVTADYEFPYLAHAPMEPMNCTIHFDGERARLWSGHQAPTWDRDATAKILGIPKENVELNVVYAGGSFGRRGNKVSDYIVEAANLAKLVKKPIKIHWTREDDMKGGFYRPMTFHRAEIGFDAKNHLSGWRHQVVGQSVVAGSVLEAMMVHNGVEELVVEGVAHTPYDVADFSVNMQSPAPNITTSWWRSVGHTHTAYVMETLVDEIAHQMKKNPMALRKQWLKKSPRHLAVLALLEEKSGWGKTKPPKGRAWGLAIHESFKSVVGHIAEVSCDGSDVKVHRVISAVHCGKVVNPEGARNQVEGAIIYGLSAAFNGEIKIADGRPTTGNFNDYPVLRMSQAPHVEVHFVDSHDAPTGLGEPGLPAIAPAVANAVFQLTGQRIRKLPFSKGFKTT
jgi:isoquinoline 1-oxidoreductase beta subunit